MAMISFFFFFIYFNVITKTHKQIDEMHKAKSLLAACLCSQLLIVLQEEQLEVLLEQWGRVDQTSHELPFLRSVQLKLP